MASLETGRLIFIWPLSSLPHQPQCAYLEPTDIPECDDTDEEVDIELPSLSKPMGLITSGHSPGHIVVPILSHGVVSDKYAQTPPCVCQHLGASPVVGTYHDCKTLMVVMQVGMNGDVWVP